MFGCNKDEDVNVNLAVESTFYFPPLNSDEWENITLSELGWNTSELGGLLTYLEESNTMGIYRLKRRKNCNRRVFWKQYSWYSSF